MTRNQTEHEGRVLKATALDLAISPIAAGNGRLLTNWSHKLDCGQPIQHA